MLDRIFNMDNGFFRALSTFGYVWWLHVLWLLCSIPVVTMGASTTALCYACMKLHKKEGYVTTNFLQSFQENFRQSTAIFLLLLLMGIILGFNLVAGKWMEIPFYDVIKTMMLILMVPWGVTLLYVFAVQAKFRNSIWKTMQYAFWIALKNPAETICMICMILLAAGINMTIVLANFITLSMGMGIVMYVFAGYYNRIFDRILVRPEKDGS